MNAAMRFFILIAMIMVAESAFADGSAVSALNAKISAEGGTASGEGAGLVSGSVTAPLGKRFGIQADATGGTILDDFAGAFGGHLFTRDPEHYLVGVEGGYITVGGANVIRGGGEVELYINRFTFSGKAGYQLGDTSQKIKLLDGFVGGLGATFYPIDNLSIGGGASLNTGNLSGFGQLEYQPTFTGFNNLSVFAHGNSDGDHKAPSWQVCAFISAGASRSSAATAKMIRQLL